MGTMMLGGMIGLLLNCEVVMDLMDFHVTGFSLSAIATACGKSWPGWVGGYAAWSKDKPPEFNHYAFYSDVEELRRSTMLEF